jgi:hypothetical protein
MMIMTMMRGVSNNPVWNLKKGNKRGQERQPGVDIRIILKGILRI